MRTLYIMCGLPGSGKDTEARRIAEETGALIVCKDNIREMIFGKYVFNAEVEPVVKEINGLAVGVIYVESEFDIVVNECHLTAGKRKYWIELSEKYNIKPVIVYCDTPAAVCIKRRMSEPRTYTPEKWIEVIESMVLSFEPPTSAECELRIVEYKP